MISVVVAKVETLRSGDTLVLLGQIIIDMVDMWGNDTTDTCYLWTIVALPIISIKQTKTSHKSL